MWHVFVGFGDWKFLKKSVCISCFMEESNYIVVGALGGVSGMLWMMRV
jgi:hypothetical protein